MHFLALTVRFFSRHYFQVCWLHGDYYKKQLKIRLRLDQSQVWLYLVKSLYSERCTENYILYFQDMNGVTSSLIVWISDIEGLAYRNELIGLITGLMAAYLNDQPLNQSSANTEPVSESADLCSKPNRALSIPQFLKNFANSFLVMTAMLVLKIWKYLRVEKIFKPELYSNCIGLSLLALWRIWLSFEILLSMDFVVCRDGQIAVRFEGLFFNLFLLAKLTLIHCLKKISKSIENFEI